MRIPWPAWFGSLGFHLAVVLAVGVAAWAFWPQQEEAPQPPVLTFLPEQASTPTDELPPLLDPVDALPPEQSDAQLAEAEVEWDNFLERQPSPLTQWPVRAEWVSDPAAYAGSRRPTPSDADSTSEATAESQSAEATPEPSALAEPPHPAPPTPNAPNGVSDPQPSPEACPAPTYPLAARRRGIEGVVTLLVEVNSAGRVLRARVLESSGHGVLDRAAMDGVQDWRFTPARDAEGDAVAGSARVPIRFRLSQTDRR